MTSSLFRVVKFVRFFSFTIYCCVLPFMVNKDYVLNGKKFKKQKKYFFSNTPDIDRKKRQESAEFKRTLHGPIFLSKKWFSLGQQ